MLDFKSVLLVRFVSIKDGFLLLNTIFFIKFDFLIKYDLFLKSIWLIERVVYTTISYEEHGS